ncbi:phosphotransferase [Geodermatophilus sp. SYSU D00710]
MSFSPGPELLVNMEAQAQALCSRVQTSGMYLHEIEEFRFVKAAYAEAAQRAGVVQDLRSLTTPESRNLVRLVRRQDGDLAVLKLVGNTREPGEGRVLRIWHERGLPCVPPLACGEVSVSVGDKAGVVSFLLTSYLPYPTIPPVDGSTVDDRVSLLTELMVLLAPFHIPANELPEDLLGTARTWADRMHLHLRWAIPCLRRRGAREPYGWEATLNAASATGRRVLLHGDVSPSNVLDGGENGLILFDPPGALVGPPEADVGHMCTHLGGADHAARLVEEACALDRRLERDRVAFFAGVDLLLWAGYVAGSHESPHVSASEREADARISTLLEGATDLMHPAVTSATPGKR